MAYLDATSLHALPTHFETRSSEPTTILFPRGPQWSRRYQRTKTNVNDCFVYTDQGPPMYRLLGAKYNMYKIPTRTDYHFPARSYHYELRQYNTPNYRSGALTFPPGPPPPQVAMYDGVGSQEVSSSLANFTENGPVMSVNSVRAWDKYRYLPGPPSETNIITNVRELKLPSI